MSYITAVGTATPKHKFDQSMLADFMVKAMQLNYEESRKLRTIFKSSGIASRYSVLEDYGKKDNFSFYANTNDFEPFPSTQKRLNVFREHALTLSYNAVQNAIRSLASFDKSSITHLVIVCCTGMYAPGLDIELAKMLNLNSSVQRTCINFMGCYAAFNGLKVSDAFCKTDANAKVLIVCTELCSLHFQKKPSDDNLLANALFADGSAAIIMESSTTQKLKLKAESFFSDLLNDSEEDMAWTIGDQGFEMRLSSYVPGIIKGGIENLTLKLLSKTARQLSDIRYFAIHPGGKKILEAVEQALGLSKIQNAPAYTVLQNFGNMSSPTVIFVLNEIIKNLTVTDNGQHILSFAFGPGLTLESMILKIEIE